MGFIDLKKAYEILDRTDGGTFNQLNSLYGKLQILSINHNPEKPIDMCKDWYVIKRFDGLNFIRISCTNLDFFFFDQKDRF